MLYDLTDIKGRFVVYAYLTSIGAFRGPEWARITPEVEHSIGAAFAIGAAT